MWATFVIFNNISRLNNNPLGEFLPNLVTLTAGLTKCV
jgi:hypothetical protein